MNTGIHRPERTPTREFFLLLLIVLHLWFPMRQSLSEQAITNPSAEAESDRARARSLSQLAEFHSAQGRYGDAERLLREALAITEMRFGPEGLEVATILNNLGVNCKYAGRFDEGERVYEPALAIAEKSLGPNHTDAATI